MILLYIPLVISSYDKHPPFLPRTEVPPKYKRPPTIKYGLAYIYIILEGKDEGLKAT